MPGNPHIYGIKVYDTDGTTLFSSSVRVTIRNESTNEELELDTNASSEVVFNLSNFTSGWTSGDRVTRFVLYQGYEASGSDPIQDTGGTQTSLTLVATTVSYTLRYFTVQEFLDYYCISAFDEDTANGLKPETIVKVGQMVEKRIDSLTYRKWDNNAGNYYSYTNEYHTVKFTQTVFYLKNTPINSISRIEVNVNGPNSEEEWRNIMYLQLDSCDSITNWSASTDGAITLNTTNNQVKEGTGALNITKTGATVDNVTFSKTLPSTFDFTGSLFKLDYYCEDITELKATGSTAVEIRIGSDSSNYYSRVYDRTKIGPAAWSTLSIKYNTDDSDVTTTGSPDPTACNYVAIKITYASSATTVTVADMRLDNVRFNDVQDLNINYATGRVEISGGADHFPEPGKDQFRGTYKQGMSEVDEDIKLLAILMTGKRFSKGTLQRLNISANEVEGLSSAPTIANIDNEEIKSIIQTKAFPPIGGIWKEKVENQGNYRYTGYY